MACLNQYADSFKTSFEIVIRHAEVAVKYGQLCHYVASTANRVTLQPGNIHVLAIANTVGLLFIGHLYSHFCTGYFSFLCKYCTKKKRFHLRLTHLK